jgi:DNA modification methylase
MLPEWWTSQFGQQPYSIMNCIEGMKKLPDKCADMFLFDPPFNIGIPYDGYNDDIPEKDFENFLIQVMKEVDRLIKIGPVIIFFREDVYPILHAIRQTNIQFYSFLKWYRPNSQSHLLKGARIFQRIEPIIYAGKGKHTCHLKILYEDTLKYSAITPRHSEIERWEGSHPTPRPYKLYEHIIRGFTNPGDIVLDPFLGSGTTLRACRMSDRVGLGFEICPEYEELIKNRMKEGVKSKNAFEIGEEEALE